MKTLKSLLSVLLVLACLLSLMACGDEAEKAETSESPVTEEKAEANETKTDSEEASVEKTGLWKDATYLKDTEFGKGAKTLVVEVEVQGQSVTFTVKTDEKTVGAALLEHKLIDGDEGEFGLYVKVVNGMKADYDVDKSYWAFYVDGEYANTGVDSTEIREGVTYQLAYTK